MTFLMRLGASSDEVAPHKLLELDPLPPVNPPDPVPLHAEPLKTSIAPVGNATIAEPASAIVSAIKNDVIAFFMILTP